MVRALHLLAHMLGSIQSSPYPLRAGQSNVLRHLLEGKSVFSNLPTGYGKSLTYFLPAKDWGWTVWVVSPLVSLMEDQKLAAERFGLKAQILESQVSRNYDKLAGKTPDHPSERRAQIVFFSPEKFESLSCSYWLQEKMSLGEYPNLVVLDELHCFEQWQSFRPAFREVIGIFAKYFSEIPFLGLSATLSETEGLQWMKEIGKESVSVSVGMGRPNLRFRVSPQPNFEGILIDLLERLNRIQSPDCSIVYCDTRESCEFYSQLFRSMGYQAYSFHAGRPFSYRKEIIQLFRLGKIPILFATSAFGMGIDYGRVRFVAHLSPPHSISQLWQEVGRAGRDGNSADAVMYLRRSDLNFFRYVDDRQKKDFYFLWEMFWMKKCRKVYIAEFFGMQEKICGFCDYCESNFGNPAKKLWWEENPQELKHWVKKKFFSSLKKS